MTSKTVSELSKLSANTMAFDLPVHEGGQVPTSHDSVRTLDRPKNGVAANKRARAAESDLGMLIRAASAVDGPTPASSTLWVPDRTEPQPIGGVFKRLFDIALAGSTLVLLSPLLLTVALMIYATAGRPILFPQRRLGFAGRPFACYKFRTMVNDAEAVLKAYLASNPDAAREWNARQKLQNDPRVTTLGHILRRSSLDELPQLLNVLKGDMSCVGPRPVVNDEIPRYRRYWKHYTQVRPGLTGAWQVSGRNRLSYRRRVALDSHYVRKWSLGRDMWILIKTIPAVLRSDTA